MGGEPVHLEAERGQPEHLDATRAEPSRFAEDPRKLVVEPLSTESHRVTKRARPPVDRDHVFPRSGRPSVDGKPPPGS